MFWLSATPCTKPRLTVASRASRLLSMKFDSVQASTALNTPMANAPDTTNRGSNSSLPMSRHLLRPVRPS